ncbi:MAG: hypothetical protein U0529_02845 [Thermoanaerobaculia bacterium]
MPGEGGGAAAIADREDAGRSFALGALTSLAALLLLAELVCRSLLATGGLYRLVDASGSLTSVAEARARARAFAPGDAVALLGDSVAGPTALLQHRVPGARGKTLTAELGRRLAPRGVLPLSADGMLLPDLEGLLESLDEEPRDAVLLLNFRMFAAPYESPGAAASRDAFLPRGDVALRSARPAGDRLGSRLYESAAAASPFFLVTQVLRARAFAPSRKDVLERVLARLLPAADDDDLAASVLRLRIAPIYEDRAWNASAPAFASLSRILARRRSARTLVALTPQNPVETASLSPERLRSNRDLLRRAVEAGLGPAGRYLDLADALPEDAFLDHCHLTGQGNARVAEALASTLGRGAGGVAP